MAEDLALADIIYAAGVSQSPGDQITEDYMQSLVLISINPYFRFSLLNWCLGIS